MIGSGALSVVVVLSEEDAVAQEGEAGSSVHLPLEQLGLGVHALGASVVVGEGDRCGDGVDVLVDASGEGVQVGRSASRVAVFQSANRVGFPCEEPV